MNHTRCRTLRIVSGLSLLWLISLLWARPATAATAPLPVQPLVTQLTLHAERALPGFAVITPARGPAGTMRLAVAGLQFHGTLPRQHPPALAPSEQTPGLVDNWQPLLVGDFETQPLPSGCAVTSGQVDQPTRPWVGAKGVGIEGSRAIAPTVAKQERSSEAIPLDSWLLCGPFDLRNSANLLVEFAYQHSLPDPLRSRFFFGASTDGHKFAGSLSTGATTGWLQRHELIEGVAGQRQVWLAWAFQRTAYADGRVPLAQLWLDQLRIWRYQWPRASCGELPPSGKGVVLPAYDPTSPAGHSPILRGGDTHAADLLVDADIRWVRLGFQQQAGAIDLLAYDRMIDSLCARGIGVLGLINQETLASDGYRRQDFAGLVAYQQEFAAQAGFLAHHFRGRIRHWEVWNEPNLGEGAYLPPAHYATLLQQSQLAIKLADPAAQVIFGGLASAWGDSNAYLAEVYAVWEQTLGGVHPFDQLAVHPYPREQEGPQPARYLHAEKSQGYATILDKFLQTMSEHGDGDKKLWITEIGLNSARGSATQPWCFQSILVSEQEQATYLKPLYDILLTEVTLWQQPNQPAVEQIFWYQFMDVGVRNPCNTGSGSGQGYDWWFGLYRGDKASPKPITCAFWAYPLTCEERRKRLTLNG